MTTTQRQRIEALDRASDLLITLSQNCDTFDLNVMDSLRQLQIIKSELELGELVLKSGLVEE